MHTDTVTRHHYTIDMPSQTVVLLPMWAPGHFSSMLEAGKRLLLCSGGAFSLTVLVVPPPMDSEAPDVTSQIDRETASGAHYSISFRRLPAVDHGRGPVHPSEYFRLFAAHVEMAIASSPASVAAVVVDLFSTMMLDVAHGLAVPGYVYFPSTGALLALMLRLPAVHEELAVKLREKEGGFVDVPGLPPVPVASMPSPQLNDYAWLAYHGRRFVEASGIIVNTVAELEPGVLAAIADGRCTPDDRAATMVYPIGPVLSLKPRDDDQPQHECVRWLDAQRPASVVFLCFGSKGWFDAEQVREVAAGLERSEQSFLWVLRGPPAGGDSGYPTDADLDALLPKGFLERTRGKGLVWPRWAPQSAILAHVAVGGFVTHCGWNSVLESLWFGVPMAQWPLYAEQPLNAFELVACMGVAVELRMCTGRDSFVEAAELECTVRSLMGGSEEGRKAKKKAAEMKAVCRKAVEKDGSSFAATQKVVQDMLAA